MPSVDPISSIAVVGKDNDVFSGFHFVCGPQTIQLLNVDDGLRVIETVGSNSYYEQDYDYADWGKAVADWRARVAESIHTEVLYTQFCCGLEEAPAPEGRDAPHLDMGQSYSPRD